MEMRKNRVKYQVKNMFGFKDEFKGMTKG